MTSNLKRKYLRESSWNFLVQIFSFILGFLVKSLVAIDSDWRWCSPLAPFSVIRDLGRWTRPLAWASKRLATCSATKLRRDQSCFTFGKTQDARIRERGSERELHDKPMPMPWALPFHSHDMNSIKPFKKIRIQLFLIKNCWAKINQKREAKLRVKICRKSPESTVLISWLSISFQNFQKNHIFFI